MLVDRSPRDGTLRREARSPSPAQHQFLQQHYLTSPATLNGAVWAPTRRQFATLHSLPREGQKEQAPVHNKADTVSALQNSQTASTQPTAQVTRVPLLLFPENMRA
jgi:hypothetical protein